MRAAILFASGGFSGRFNLLLGRFFLFVYAKLLSFVFVLGLILPTFVLDYAVIFLHGKTTPALPGRSYAGPGLRILTHLNVCPPTTRR